jgi:hypothetical protein
MAAADHSIRRARMLPRQAWNFLLPSAVDLVHLAVDVMENAVSRLLGRPARSRPCV